MLFMQEQKLRNFITYFTCIAGVVILNAIPYGCRTDEPPGKLVYIATIPPIAMILEEIIGDRGEVISLLQPGASPHTYDPSPSDAAELEKATAFFYVHENIDGWAMSLQSRHKTRVFDFVPAEMRLTLTTHLHEWEEGGQDEEQDAGDDPHFWTDPMVVVAVVPALVYELSKLDPGGALIYRANASAFIDELKRIDGIIREVLAEFSGSEFIMFHPSFNYYFKTYGLKAAAYVEPFPGKEPSAKYITELIDVAREHDVKAIFTEPQLPAGPANAIADETGLSVYILDPIGGVERRATYTGLIQYNTDTIIQALIDDEIPQKRMDTPGQDE